MDAEVWFHSSLSLVRNPKHSNEFLHHCRPTVASIPYEWAMKNFSSHFLEEPNKPIPETSQESVKERKKQDAEDDDTPRCEWEFSLSTLISSPSFNGRAVSDTLGVIEFDPTDSFLATGGIARKIRIYSVNSLLPDEGISRVNQGITLLDHAAACDYYIYTPAKLSSLRWKPGSGGRLLGSGDYDGVVMEYDLERRVPVLERDEHGGRRVWSIDYSHSDPVVGASGSDDGTMQMWDPRCCDGGRCLAAVQPNTALRSPVCCLEFNPFGGALVAAGCADSKVYCYDIRRMAEPVIVFHGHQKSVTYIKFLDFETIVTSAIDGCLKMWDSESQRIIRTYRGHVNSRRFVGLSVWRGGGLLCCGSENNQVFVYDKRWGAPIWVQGFELGGGDGNGGGRGFVSSVCWRQIGEDRCTLVAAGASDGTLQVFEGKRKEM